VHVPTSDLTRPGAPPPPIEVHVLALGVLPAYRRRGLGTRLLQTAAAHLRALAANAPQLPTLHSTCSGMRVFAGVVRADGCARAFWKHVGLLEQDRAPPHREAWVVGDVLSVAGLITSAA